MNGVSKAIVVLGACVVPAAFAAETYPARPVRVIVPYSPGGGTDVLARPVLLKLTESMGQQFVVDNRAGANSIIGTELVARSRPDGYTLLVGTTATSSNAGLYKKLPYDTLTALAPISLIANAPFFLVANAALPANSVKELIALAKANPGKINFGSAGIGGTPHLAGEMFNVRAGVKMVHVAYKGAAESIVDLIAAQVQVMFTGLPATIHHVRAGKLKLLAVADPKRSSLMPELPTIAESGIPGFEAASWYGIFGPAGVPRTVQARLAGEIAKAVQAKDLHERFVAFGAEPLWNTPEQFAAYFREDVIKWAKIVKESGARAD